MKIKTLFVIIIVYIPLLLSGCATQSPPSKDTETKLIAPIIVQSPDQEGEKHNGQQGPSASQYPADISGYVTIAEKLMANGEDRGREENEVFWLVNISVDKHNYKKPITANYSQWIIVAGNDTYQVPEIIKTIDAMPSPINIPSGGNGQLLMGFYVPRDLTLTNAEVGYIGERPYSYGKLTGGKKVYAYDSFSGKVITSKEGPDLPLLESYLVRNRMEPADKIMTLKTIGFWKGSESEQIIFEVDKSPAVINLGYTETSQISSSFRLLLRSSSEAKAGMPGYWSVYNGYRLEETGEYDIQVKASGVDWWIKIGVEP